MSTTENIVAEPVEATSSHAGAESVDQPGPVDQNGLIEEDSLIEEVSIDGMCGVY